MTCPFREWDVAYVLGSLSPGDRQAYERHLSACPPCEHEVGRLAGTAGLLSRVPAEWAVESLEPGAALPATVLPRLARAARRRRLLVMATTVLVAALIGAVVAFCLCP
ncbi:anti-sigma factor family protein [Lentzea aerocolonigenes]|uniref:anti-sigma factor family protein n=1 Tax=Lentzea aerocolonigenes TaxID=68170 RepID=UPI000698AEC5|nr:zf-HC2 domain-containing protein [Lentzea aerocolonigenes]